MYLDFVEILRNDIIAAGVVRMEIRSAELAAACRPGQFINLYTGNDAMLLPRPISVCLTDKKTGVITLVYKVAGDGTALLSGYKPGQSIKAMGPLGNGYPLEPELLSKPGAVTLVGGGVGIPPLLELARAIIIEQQKPVTAVLGYRDYEAFLLDDFKRLGADVKVASDDGSAGFKGNAVALLINEPEINPGVIYSCGPLPMLKALWAYASERGMLNDSYFSLEERMGCGFGVCLGCAVSVKNGENESYKKVCTDGPVFRGTELAWSGGDER